MSKADQALIERLIPLPREVAQNGSRVVPVAGVRAKCEPVAATEPRVARALRLLAEAGIGGSGGLEAFRIECLLQNGTVPLPAGLREVGRRLATLPNAAQAYAIVPEASEAGRFRSLTLLANGPLGILYAVRTLLQIFVPSKTDELRIPCVTVVDWPELEERGQWGGNTHDEVDWTARWKLNVIEESVGLSVDDRGQTALALEQRHISHAFGEGVSIVPYVLHLEQVALYAGLMSRRDLTSTPDPSKPLPSEYVPGLCMSSPATIRLVGGWMELIAGYEHIPAIEVWLSEDRSPCFCERCSGREPFELEVQCIQEAFRRARARGPELKLRILLTQGSYPVNDRVIAVSEPEVQLSYYDGGRTYDSSHAPMITPLLEEYARSGRWLGVYPQITHCWRTVFPFTAPQLLAARAREFADKGLANVIGYAVPSNRHHEFNVMALAEWTWNPRGRSPEELARAYARFRGMQDPELYARWALRAGEAGWWLAESRMLLRFIYNYDVDVAVGGERTEDHRFRQAGVSYDRATTEGAVKLALEARELAARSGIPALEDESDAVHAGLVALLCLDELSDLAHRGVGGTQLSAPLDRLDRASAVMCRSVSRWGESINATIPASSSSVGAMWVRLRDTANVLFRVCDTLRSRAPFRDLRDPYVRHRQLRLGAWSAADFGSDSVARLSFDVTDRVSSGHCFACFTYAQGHYAAEIVSVSLRRRTSSGVEEILSRTTDERMRVGRWEAWHELKLVLPVEPGREGARLYLDVELSVVILEGSRRESWECAGEIGFRPGWPEATAV